MIIAPLKNVHIYRILKMNIKCIPFAEQNIGKIFLQRNNISSEEIKM